MTGFSPLSRENGGKLVFNTKHALNPHHPIKLPCGVCIGCRADRAGDWAMRCMHEAQMHPQNCFITLTYDDEHLPEDYSVHVRVLQLFMKKLRKKYQPKKIRFYSCGEYGPENLRPHYHSILFNHDFNDKIFYKKTPQSNNLYTSKSLEQIWGFGFCTTGDVTYQSAGYVAQYVMKKITGERALTHYLRSHPVTNSVVKVEPEFSLQSRRPGLASTWFDKYKNDCFPSDFLVIDGKQRRVPQFYSLKLQEEELTKIKRKRKSDALPRRANSTPERLRVRETVKKLKLTQLKRTL
jgi:hypothetical protein